MATTKSKKVETPIDERETFVSLQKSFADSEANIQEKLKTLYALQEADNEIEKIVQLRGELPAEVAALEGDVAAIEGKIAHVNELIEEYLRSIEGRFQGRTGRRCKISCSGKKRAIQIEFRDNADLEAICKLIGGDDFFEDF